MERSVFSFDPFARDRRYISVNAQLVRLLLRHRGRGRPTLQVLDLGCGTGLLTKLLLGACQRWGGGAQVVCLDPDRQALRIAHRELAAAPTAFVAARAEGLPLASAAFDLVLFGNAIHLVKDKEQTVREIHRVLRPQGLFAFNTTYYTGAYPEESRSYYLRWTRRALALLRAHRLERASRGSRAVAMEWLSPEQYRELLERAGFQILYRGERLAQLLQKSVRTIASYRDFVQGALRVADSELAAASRALQRTVRPTFHEEGIKALPRRWLEVIAQKG